MLFAFSQHAKWDDEAGGAVVVAYTVERERGFLRVPAAVFSAIFGRRIAAAACLDAYYLHRVQFERTAEALRRSGIVEPNGDIVIQVFDLPQC